MECAIYETASGEEVYGCSHPRAYEHEDCYEVTFYTLEGEQPYAKLNTCEGEEPHAPPEPPEEQLPPDEPPEEERPPDQQPPAEEAPSGRERPGVEEGLQPAEGSSSAEGPAFLRDAASQPPAWEEPRPAVPDPEEGVPHSPSRPFSGGAVGNAVEAVEEAVAGGLELLVGRPVPWPEIGGQNSGWVALTDLFFGGRADHAPAVPPFYIPIDRGPSSASASPDSGSGLHYGDPPRPFFPTEPPLLCGFFSVPVLARRGGRLYELLFGSWKPGSALRPALERPG